MYNGHGSSKKGAVNLCKMFRQITEAWESAPVDLKLGKVSDSLLFAITPKFLEFIQCMVFKFFCFVSVQTKNTNCRPLCVFFS